MIERGKVTLFTETRNGKIYLVFQDGLNHICGQVAIGDQNILMREAQNLMPEELLQNFLNDGYRGMGQ